MNIDSTTAIPTPTKPAETSAPQATTPLKKDDSTSFKEQLNATKTQDEKISQLEKAQEATVIKTAETTKTANETAVKQTALTQETQQNASNQKTSAEDLAKTQLAQQVAGDKLINKNINNKNVTDPITELSSKIATINELKSGVSKAKEFRFKNIETNDKIDIGQTIKMDTNDVTFFLNLVGNQQMSAQAVQGLTQNLANTEFTSIQTEATQQTVQVSSTLLDAMNESAKTGKSFRIDFDSDVAVIMKVDRNGTLSANFIPGDTAVENYLRNNISLLKQTFEDKGLAYNELTYSRQHKQEQQQEKRKNNKENEDE